MNKRIIYILTLILIVGCKQDFNDPAIVPKQTLYEALQHLNAHEYDAYIQMADIACEMDSAHLDMMKMLLNQQQCRIESLQGGIANVEIVDAMLNGDTVCTVFYQLTFSDSTRDISSQKLIRMGNTWKLRLRN